MWTGTSWGSLGVWPHSAKEPGKNVTLVYILRAQRVFGLSLVRLEAVATLPLNLDIWTPWSPSALPSDLGSGTSVFWDRLAPRLPVANR